MTTDVIDIDASLTDPEFFAGPEFHRLFERLRVEDPVHWTVGNYERGFWSLSRYADCVQIMSDATLFSNLAGPHLPPKGRDLTPEEDRKFGTGVHILMSDPPEHGRRRRPMNKHFSMPVVTPMRPLFAEIVTEILDAAEAKNDIDLVIDVADQLPVKVILRLLGVVEADWAALQGMVARALHAQDPEYRLAQPDEMEARITYIDHVYQYCAGLIRERRLHPAEDYATILAQLRDGDELFSEHEAAFMAVGFVLGGLEGTRNAASVGLLELLARPEQAQQVAASPELAKSAVEEVLRWSTPSKNRLRLATADTEIGGKRITKGDWVVGWVTSANRDEAVFDRPNEFDITRSPNRHLSLGLGTHACIGRGMARLELEILFSEFFRRFPDAIALGEPEWLATNNANGLKRYPVRLDPARGDAEPMLSVIFTVEETGEEHVLDATGHPSVMHLARDNDVPYIEGECGGDMTCGTCHVYVESLPIGYVTEPGADERDMLEVVRDPRECSRLACQLPVTDRIDGLRLRVPAT